MTITCGIDWAESHHDVALVDGTGKLVAERRISDDAEGLRRLLDLPAEAGDTAGDPMPVAVETARGLLISCLRATGRAVLDQPDGRGPLPRAPPGRPGEIGSRGCGGAGQHPAHRRRLGTDREGRGFGFGWTECQDRDVASVRL